MTRYQLQLSCLPFLYLHVILQLDLHAVVLLFILHPQLVQLFLKLFHLPHAGVQVFQLRAQGRTPAINGDSLLPRSQLPRQHKARSHTGNSPAEQSENCPSV